MSNITKAKREYNLVESSIDHLTHLIIEAVNAHVEVSPIYREINNRVLKLLNNEAEMANMEVKELIKLTEVAQKAQLAPVEQLTKLVQAVTQLRDSNALEERLREVEHLVTAIKQEATGTVINMDETAYQTIGDVDND